MINLQIGQSMQCELCVSLTTWQMTANLWMTIKNTLSIIKNCVKIKNGKVNFGEKKFDYAPLKT